MKTPAATAATAAGVAKAAVSVSLFCALMLQQHVSFINAYKCSKKKNMLKHVNKKSKHRQSLYSIEFGPSSVDTIRSRTDTILDYDDQLRERDGAELSPKPMTPRRVKRRSVMARGTNSRTSNTSRRSHGGGGSGTHHRSSTRSSRRKYQQNPVTKLLDQQQLQLQQQHHHQHRHQHGKQEFGSFHHKRNADLTATNLQTLNQEIISLSGSTTNNIMAGTGGSLTKSNNNHYHSFRKNIPPDPIYYNTNGVGLYQQQPALALAQQQPMWRASSQSPIAADEPTSPTLTPTTLTGGHYNPTYQHSNTNLHHEGEAVDEMYNNRPPSVRSSYSNFHGTRPLSSYLPGTGATENVFVGLPGAAQQQQQQQLQHVPPSTPPLYQQHPLQHRHPHSASQQQLPPLPTSSFASSQPQQIPFAKRTASRESIRSMAFLNSGPPAYNLNYHTPPDSETTM